VAETFAVAGTLPNSPKANPVIATPATRALTMRNTVVKSGEIALLELCFFIIGLILRAVFLL